MMGEERLQRHPFKEQDRVKERGEQGAICHIELVMIAPFADEQRLERGEVGMQRRDGGREGLGFGSGDRRFEEREDLGRDREVREADQRSLRGAPLGGRCLAGSQGSDLRGSQE